MRAAIIFTLFSVFEWTGENGSNTLRVDAYFLKNGRQNSPFSKIFGCLWTGPKPTVFFLPFSWRRRRRCLRSPLSFLLIISSLLSPKCAWWTSTHTFTPYLPLFRNTHAHSEVFRLQKHHNLIEYFRCHYIQNTISLLYEELKGPWCHRDLHCEILKGKYLFQWVTFPPCVIVYLIQYNATQSTARNKSFWLTTKPVIHLQFLEWHFDQEGC